MSSISKRGTASFDNSPFPQFRMTELGDSATIVAENMGSYYGFICESDRPMSQTIMRWDCKGQALTSYGEPIPAINWDIRPN